MAQADSLPHAATLDNTVKLYLNMPQNHLVRSCLLLFCGAAFCQVSTLDPRLTSDRKPAATHVYIHDAIGRSHMAPGTIVYSRRGEEHSIIDGRAQLQLSPGVELIQAEKGPEFAVVEQTVQLAADLTRRAEDLPPYAQSELIVVDSSHALGLQRQEVERNFQRT